MFFNEFILFSVERNAPVDKGDIRDRVRNGNELKIDFHHPSITKEHGHIAIVGIFLHVLSGKFIAKNC